MMHETENNCFLGQTCKLRPFTDDSIDFITCEPFVRMFKIALDTKNALTLNPLNQSIYSIAMFY